MGIESIFVCNRRIPEAIHFRAVLALAELRSGTVLHIMTREASPAEGRFVQTGIEEITGSKEHNRTYGPRRLAHIYESRVYAAKWSPTSKNATSGINRYNAIQRPPCLRWNVATVSKLKWDQRR